MIDQGRDIWVTKRHQVQIFRVQRAPHTDEEAEFTAAVRCCRYSSQRIDMRGRNVRYSADPCVAARQVIGSVNRREDFG